MPRKKHPPAPIYQLKITLSDSKPPIWRRVLVSGHTTLSTLHRIIQMVMGWNDYHLHEFEIAGQRYTDPMVDIEGDKNEAFVRLKQLIPHEKTKFRYIYDFGDGWLHEILVEKILPPDPEKERKLPLCLKGKRACPPEDVGGINGYYDFLEAIQDPNHPDHKHLSNWIEAVEHVKSEEEENEDISEQNPETPLFDPEYFNLEEANNVLAELRPRR